MQNPLLIKSLLAGAAVSPYRIVKQSDDNTVIQGAAVSDALCGISNNLGGESGKRIDVVMAGIYEVEYGATVTLGAPLTSDATGRAVVAAPAAGANNRIIGFALQAGVVGDIGTAQISPGSIQG